jgi:hypothetical protein
MGALVPREVAASMKRLFIVVVTIGLTLAPSAANARWTASASAAGRAYSGADTVPAGEQPTTSVNGRNITVSWAASTFDDGSPVTGYVVHRYDAATDLEKTVGAACAGVLTALSCTESAVAPGTWYYTVAPRAYAWVGPEGLQSANVTIDPPALTFTTLANITTLPKTLSGSIAGYLNGETVTWRLDNPSTGTVLTGSTTPSPVGAAGTANISVTIPVGTSNGTHTVYAVGSGGSTASGTIAINVSDTTPPTVTASVIAKSTGGTTGVIRQGGQYYLYANATDPGTPSSGVAQVRANVGSVTTGSTNVSLTAGSYVIGGVTYGWRSNALAASNPLAAGSKTYTVWAIDAVGNTGAPSSYGVTVDNTVPTATDIQTTNAGTAGRAETGDKIIYTFSENLEPISILAGWNGSVTTVTLRLISKGGGDRVQIWNSGNTAQLPIGLVQLNRTDYVTKTSSFTSSSMALAGNVLTVTLGTTTSTSVTTAAGTGTMRYTPSATMTDLAGNAASTANCNETGAADVDL